MSLPCYCERMTNVPLGSNAFFDLSAKDAAGVPHSATYSATISDTAVGYIAKQGSARIFMVAKAAGTVNIVISGTSQDGTALPIVTVEYTVPTAGGETQAKRAGKQRLELKTYVMQDYDITNFRFNK